MLLPRFDFHEPQTLSEACQVMAHFRGKAKVIAGGTDLLVDMKRKATSPEQIVSIARINELRQIDLSSDTLRIGSCVTVSEIEASNVIGKRWAALCSGARALGNPLVRNLATIGGNLGSASPSADLPPSLVAYGARALLKKESAERVVPLDRFFLGAGLTEIGPDEILKEIQIDAPPPFSGAGYINEGIRKCRDCNVVNVASFLTLESPGGAIKEARIVMGCVGPPGLRAHEAEKLLIGERPSEELFKRAGESAMQECSPRGHAHSRASAPYKRDMVGVLAQRTLAMALKEALGK